MKPATESKPEGISFGRFRNRLASEAALALVIASMNLQPALSGEAASNGDQQKLELRLANDGSVNSDSVGVIGSTLGIAPDNSYKNILGLDSGSEVFRLYWKHKLDANGATDKAALGAKLPFDLGAVRNDLIVHGAFGQTPGIGLANLSGFGRVSLGEILELNSNGDSRIGASIDYRINEMLKLGLAFDNASISGHDTQQYLVNLIYQPGAKDLFGVAYVQRLREIGPQHIVRMSALKKPGDFGLAYTQEFKIDDVLDNYAFSGTLYLAKNPAFGRKAVTGYLETRPQYGGFMDSDLAVFDRSISIIEPLHLQDRSFAGGAVMASYKVAIKPGYESLDVGLGYGHAFGGKFLGGRIGLSGEVDYHHDSKDSSLLSVLPKVSWRHSGKTGVLELYFGASVPVLKDHSGDAAKPLFVFGAGKTF